MKMNVVIDNQTYTVEIEDIHARPVIARVEGERFAVWPEEAEKEGPSAAALEAPEVSVPPTAPKPAAAPPAEDGDSVRAPLPGVIVALMVEPGDSVARGQEICTLEAMKMKNAIRANRDGTIGSVKVSVGDQVGHGQVLMTYSD